jgi:hypothetical protein
LQGLQGPQGPSGSSHAYATSAGITSFTVVPTTVETLSPPAGNYVVSATGAAVQQSSSNKDHCELELNSMDFAEVDSWPTSTVSQSYAIVGTTSVSTGDKVNLVCWLQSGNGIGAVTQNSLVASQVDNID